MSLKLIKKSKFIYYLAVSLAVSAFAIQSHAQAPQTVTFASGEWEPYQGAALDEGGPAAKVVSESFASQGWTVQYQYMPWARGLDEARLAHLDGTFLYSYNDDRSQDFLFSEPVIELETVVFYWNERPLNWSNPEDLKGKTLGAVVAYDYGFITDEAGYNLDRIGVPENNFRKLQAGRVDGVMEEIQVGLALARAVGIEDSVSYAPQPIKAVPYHLIVSRAHPQAQTIIDTFNAGLEHLKSTGRLNDILYPQ
ncbi:substrate-binding periplasmic protein [Nitrincola alkalilacustris]|uniref:substrate-binding periplasmic protein n=1 Tax=Nitrincola alkalilacustris TaxID=1571224 RepID=UPI00124D147B|nr:transporter substrate-binding domain-containing protein [Nitrincola alkalilacustris]